MSEDILVLAVACFRLELELGKAFVSLKRMPHCVQSHRGQVSGFEGVVQSEQTGEMVYC